MTENNQSGGKKKRTRADFIAQQTKLLQQFPQSKVLLADTPETQALYFLSINLEAVFKPLKKFNGAKPGFNPEKIAKRQKEIFGKIVDLAESIKGVNDEFGLKAYNEPQQIADLKAILADNNSDTKE